MEELLSLPQKIGQSYCQEMTELRGTGFLIGYLEWPDVKSFILFFTGFVCAINWLRPEKFPIIYMG